MRKKFSIILFLLLVLLISACSKNNFLEIHIIDVNQGDSSLIITPNKISILVDAGEDEYSRNVIRELKLSGIKKIDYIIATHFDSDHIGGLDKVISEFDIENIIIPPGSENHKDYYEFREAYYRKNKKPIIINDYQVIPIDEDINMYILSPTNLKIDKYFNYEHSSEDLNKNSIVFILKYMDYKMLFTGDIDSDVEKTLIDKYNIENLTFLKVAHHGSKYSSSDEFLSVVNPKIASISCGYKNRYGHPHQETLNRFKKYHSLVYRTDYNGTMIFYFDKEGIFTKNKYKID